MLLPSVLIRRCQDERERCDYFIILLSHIVQGAKETGTHDNAALRPTEIPPAFFPEKGSHLLFFESSIEKRSIRTLHSTYHNDDVSYNILRAILPKRDRCRHRWEVVSTSMLFFVSRILDFIYYTLCNEHSTNRRVSGGDHSHKHMILFSDHISVMEISWGLVRCFTFFLRILDDANFSKSIVEKR